jgi:hypothetical protein
MFVKTRTKPAKDSRKNDRGDRIPRRIQRPDFEKELKKLDMLFKARGSNMRKYSKSRLQKMELEKFSDANVELHWPEARDDGQLTSSMSS